MISIKYDLNLKTLGAIAATSFLVAEIALGFCFPRNNLHLEDDLHSKNAKITQSEFNSIVQTFKTIYAPIIQNHGASFVVRADWQSSLVNALANQKNNDWIIEVYGGLARRKEITADALTLVICHEIGHHIGGFPFKHSWGASEGQADYFATHSCLRKIWQNDLTLNAQFAYAVDKTGKNQCDKFWQFDEERHLCYRSLAASESIGAFLASLTGGNPPEFSTPSVYIAPKTRKYHFGSQCRLDTLLAGATCEIPFDLGQIPGKGLPWLDAREEAFLVSCHRSSGQDETARPRCWFNPKH